MKERLSRIYSRFVWSILGITCAFVFLPSLPMLQGNLGFMESRAAFAAESAPPVPFNFTQDALPMLDYTDAYLDVTGKLNIAQVSEAAFQGRFTPYIAEKLPHEAGALWLRFTIAARAANEEASTFLLDLGEGIPGTPLLFAPFFDSLTQQEVWREYVPDQHSVFLMPEARQKNMTVYIRLDGVPSLWFSPMLRSPHDAATSIERFAKPAVMVALAVVMLLCFLRGLTEAGQWRIWAGLYTAITLVFVYTGMPVTGRGYISFANILPVLSPGTALILLPHVARHLMRSYDLSRSIDWQYRLLTFVGIVVALLPLLPGFAWLSRYLELWPLATLLFVPTTVGAWLGGLPGARRFLVACLLPPLGVAVTFVGMQGPHFFPPALLVTLPLWGVALSALLIAATATPVEYMLSATTDTQKAQTDESIAHLIAEDPNLRLVCVEEAQSTDDNTRSENVNQAVRLEELLRWPMDDLLRHVAAFESCALPMAAREHMSLLSQTSREISHILSAPVMEHSVVHSFGGIKENIFDLQSLLRQAHDSVSAVADSKNIALSWFMPPQLGRVYKGDALQLLFVLRLLLESAVRATNRGAVQLSVRRVPESVNPGHLLFAVTDTGTGKPPQERSVSSLARAWELAASCHGFLGVETNAHCASISFTAHCEVTTQDMLHMEQQENTLVQNCRILLTSDSAASRQLWTFFVDNMPCALIEARTGEEALSIYKEAPVHLLIFDACMPGATLAKTIQALRDYEEKYGIEQSLCLAISAPEEERDNLHDMGFDYVLLSPVTRTDLRSTIDIILEEYAKHMSTLRGEDAADIDMTDTQNLDEAEKEVVPYTQAYSQDDENIENTHASILANSFEADATVKEEMPEEVKDNAEETEEIIDTGMPILNMHVPPVSDASLSSPSATPHDEQNTAPTSLQSLTLDMPTFADTPSAPSQEQQAERVVSPENAMENRIPEQSFAEEALVHSRIAEMFDSAAEQPLLPEQKRRFAGPFDPFDPLGSFEEFVAKAEQKEKIVQQESSYTEEKQEEKKVKKAPIIINKKPTIKAGTSRIKKVKTSAPLPTVSDKSVVSDASEMPIVPEMPMTSPLISKDKSNAAYISSFVEVENTEANTAQSWVGEPMPIQKEPESEQISSVLANTSAFSEFSELAKKHADTTEMTFAPVVSEPAKHDGTNGLWSENSEWVGEPMPVTKEKPTLKIMKNLPVQGAKPSQIVQEAVVEPKKEVLQGADKKREKKNKAIIVSKPIAKIKKEGAKSQVVLHKPENTKLASKEISPPVPFDAVQEPKGAPQPVQDTYKETKVSKPPVSEAAMSLSQAELTFTDDTDDMDKISPLDNLLGDIDIWTQDARTCLNQRNALGVETATNSIAGNAESFGLRTLGRLARTVEAAARAKDFDALNDLLPELEISVERNRIAMKQ